MVGEDMIRFSAEFKFLPGPESAPVRIIRPEGNIWYPFNTKRQQIMCNVVYLGPDPLLQDGKWYLGLIELPYGERFRPYTKHPFEDLDEPININETYNLNAGDRIVAECILKTVEEIVWGDFDVNTHPRGTKGYYTYL